MPAPDWPTTMRSRLADGRIIGVDRSNWLYMAVPMAPFVDAVDKAALAMAMAPISLANDALSRMAQVRVPRRALARSYYREVHILVINVPALFSPPRDNQVAGYLAEAYADKIVDKRLCLYGVRLEAHIGASSLRQTVEMVTDTLLYGGSPEELYERDYADAHKALVSAGMVDATKQDIAFANSWWAYGHAPDTPLLVHSDHLHVFSSPKAARAVARLKERVPDCDDWPAMDGASTLAFGCVVDWDLPPVDELDAGAMWIPELLRLGAVCVSIRGRIEPPRVTRNELRANRAKYIRDIEERASQGKLERAEQEEMARDLGEVEAIFASPDAPPALVDCSTVVAFSGKSERTGYDLSDVGLHAGLSLANLVNRQRAGMAECWLASNVRANPYLHDLPGHVVAASGANNLSVVGDRDGALLGFTERDRQPAYVSPTAASVLDGLPVLAIFGATGSGKTVTALHLAYQFSRMRNHKGQRAPVVFVDPKAFSDHGPTVLAAGGQVYSLDNLISADGVFDPLRFSRDPAVGVDIASSMLMAVNPWGSRREDYETPVVKALSYGVEHGATCTGQALRKALDDGVAIPEMVQAVFDLASASPMFRACVGIDPGGPAMSVSEGLTLIKVGSSYLNLPEPGTPEELMSQQHRVAVALVRAMVFGSAMALAGREGVLMLDEAWVMLTAGRTEVDRLGRLARSQQVLPVLLTQKTTDALSAGLAGYISRGIILPIADRDEARAALQLFRLEPTEERLARITAPATVGAIGADVDAAPNWGSFRALRDPKTGAVLRGAVGLYVDLSGRAVPVEVDLPASFLAMASTNPEDIRRREEAVAPL